MTSGDVESWARLRLVQGKSTAQVWELMSSVGQTTLTVGSDAACNWIVHHHGVAPVHLSLHWDGSVLRVADTHGAGNVRVDGAPVSAQWRSLTGRLRIDFGKAAIVVETSVSSSPSDAPDPRDLVPIPTVSGAGRRLPGVSKATLLGVAPRPNVSSEPPLRVPTPQLETGGPSQRAPSESLRTQRFSEAERAHKATLIGVASTDSSLPPGSAPMFEALGSRPPPSGQPASGAATAASNVHANRTLMGIGVSDIMRAMASGAAPQRIAGVGLGDGDQGTIQGVSSSNGSVSVETPSSGSPGAGQGVAVPATVSEPTGVALGTMVSAPVLDRTSPAGDDVSAGELPHVSGAGAWHSDQAKEQVRPVAEGIPPTPAPPHERFSEAHAPSDFAAIERPSKPFPWSYVGIALLTATAYFAWLYLLDHL